LCRCTEGKGKWAKARAALQSKRAGLHLSNVSNDRWTDANSLFEYYNNTYFESALHEVGGGCKLQYVWV
jgi:hypothetical protein